MKKFNIGGKIAAAVEKAYEEYHSQQKDISKKAAEIIAQARLFRLWERASEKPATIIITWLKKSIWTIKFAISILIRIRFARRRKNIRRISFFMT